MVWWSLVHYERNTMNKFYKGLAIGLLIAIPFWALIWYGATTVAGIE